MPEQLNIETYRRALDAARRIAPNDAEYWMARDLQGILNYQRWQNFDDLIAKSKLACDNSGEDSEHHFRLTTKMVGIGSGTIRKVRDWFLSRYACYLIAMNGDSGLSEVAYAQQYFAVKTRLQEQAETYNRIEHRKRVTASQKALNSAAKGAEVQRYGLFYDAGYRGLYGGLGLSAIKAKKRIDEKEELLDRAGRLELAAIELKNVHTEDRLITLNIRGEQAAMDTHHRVGKEIRSAIERIGGTMPEDLPAEESVKKLAVEHKQKKLIPPLS